jgi:hypothetical protein
MLTVSPSPLFVARGLLEILWAPASDKVSMEWPGLEVLGFVGGDQVHFYDSVAGILDLVDVPDLTLPGLGHEVVSHRTLSASVGASQWLIVTLMHS